MLLLFVISSKLNRHLTAKWWCLYDDPSNTAFPRQLHWQTPSVQIKVKCERLLLRLVLPFETDAEIDAYTPLRFLTNVRTYARIKRRRRKKAGQRNARYASKYAENIFTTVFPPSSVCTKHVTTNHDKKINVDAWMPSVERYLRR